MAAKAGNASPAVPPPWSVDEAALPSSPRPHAPNGRGEGIPEVSRTNLRAQNQQNAARAGRPSRIFVAPTPTGGRSPMSISRGIPAGEPVARLLTREQARRIACALEKSTPRCRSSSDQRSDQSGSVSHSLDRGGSCRCIGTKRCHHSPRGAKGEPDGTDKRQ
jgi:hypothetical protein